MQPPDRPFNILVAYEFSPQADVALDQALELAAGRPHCVLHVLTVLDEHGAIRHHKVDYQAAEKEQKELGEIVDARVRAAGLDNLVVFAHARIGHATDEILRMIVETQADLTVLGTHGHEGFERLLLGSVAEHVVRHAAGPVLVARSRDSSVAQGPDGPEPPCPECVERRRESGGAEWWCPIHARPYSAPHRYAYTNGAPVMPDTASGGWPVY